MLEENNSDADEPSRSEGDRRAQQEQQYNDNDDDENGSMHNKIAL